MVVFPNAKINIGLKIKYKRKDGFHELETIMYPLPLNDVLEIIPAQNTQLHLSGNVAEKISMEDNLVFKAWKLMKTNYHINPVEIYLHKNIPAGAGLGGGSADAAFMLKALNTVFKLNLTTTKLKEIAASLGSDCAFFIENRPALATGRGEITESIAADLRGYYLMLVVPKLHISTAEAYSGVLPRDCQTSLPEKIQNHLENWQKNLRNDFETHLFQQYPELKIIRDSLLDHGASYAAMSGSGSAVFGIFKAQPAPLDFSKKFSVFELQL